MNTSLLRRHSASLVVIFIIFIFCTFTIYKYQNEAYELYTQINKINEDAPEEIWRLKTILKNMVNDAVKRVNFNKPDDCLVPPLANVFDFFDYAKKEKFNCKNLVEVGGRNGVKGIGDGSKFMCFDDVVPGNCTVLSFGIDNEWSFDDDVYKLGCTVYAFDPTMGVEDHDRTPGIHFFNLGLSDFKGDMMILKKFRKVDKYENILKMLNLTDKKIDYLKIDIEGSEIEFFIDAFKYTPWIFDNVKQIAVEIHVGHPPKIPSDLYNRDNLFNIYWGIMNRIECYGYKLLHHDPNRVGGNPYKIGNVNESWCYEVVWIKE